jgi:hypothetical protein
MEKLHEFWSVDRYIYDFGLCSYRNGFAQIDTSQDASYYGTWANPFKLVIFNYCEGDCYTTLCETESEFVDEIRAIKKWNDDQGYKCAIDPGLKPEMTIKFSAMGLRDLLH